MRRSGRYVGSDGVCKRMAARLFRPCADRVADNVAQFIRHLEIPYCSLYDLGYTSLGGTTDTHPNPVLKARSEESAGQATTYRPAYELIDDGEERLGRNKY